MGEGGTRGEGLWWPAGSGEGWGSIGEGGGAPMSEGEHH